MFGFFNALRIPGAKSALLRVILYADSRKKFRDAMLGRNEVSPQVVFCARCRKQVDSEFDPTSAMTAGYYYVGGTPENNFWASMANEGEQFLCDACMWADERYIKIYGRMG